MLGTHQKLRKIIFWGVIAVITLAFLYVVAIFVALNHKEEVIVNPIIQFTTVSAAGIDIKNQVEKKRIVDELNEVLKTPFYKTFGKASDAPECHVVEVRLLEKGQQKKLVFRVNKDGIELSGTGQEVGLSSVYQRYDQNNLKHIRNQYVCAN